MTDILIVEDEPSILRSLEFILRHAGWRTQSISDGERALERILAQPPRAVILDIMLPKLSGFEILKSLRANNKTRELPILILTAKGQQRDIRTAQELGATAFITKPYANTEVVQKLKEIMGEETLVQDLNGQS